MNFDIIALITLISSFLGLIFFISKKIPVLANLQIDTTASSPGFISKIIGRIKNFRIIKFFSLDNLLHKAVSQIRVITLKADHKTAGWLKSLREKTRKKKIDDAEYWEEIKNSKTPKK